MRITAERGGLIDCAETDDGTIQFWPIGNDRLIVDGRDVYQGEYVDPVTGMVTGEAVAPDRMTAATALMREVNASREGWHRDARERSFRRQEAMQPGIPADSSFWQEEADEIAINGVRSRKRG
jgi:hypothetical protein